jgi:hypothetical protein
MADVPLFFDVAEIHPINTSMTPSPACPETPARQVAFCVLREGDKIA